MRRLIVFAVLCAVASLIGAVGAQHGWSFARAIIVAVCLLIPLNLLGVAWCGGALHRPGVGVTKLLAFALTVVAVLVAYRVAPDTSGWDAALLLYTAAGLLLLVAIMAVYTRHWTVLGAGLVGIFLGAALLRTAQASLYYHWLQMGAGDLRWVADVVRALLAAGTTWAVLGALAYIRAGKEPVNPDRLIDGPDTS